MFHPVVFREYDIRGVYNQDFDLEFAFLLGKAFAKYVFDRTGADHPRITLGYDARNSSPDIIKSLARGLVQSGSHVVHLGMVTTPISYYSTFALANVRGSIMVTGSHNPPNYNGFKISLGNTTIFGDEIQDLKKIIQKGEFLSGQGTETEIDILTPYLQRYKEEFGTLKPVKVVVDCGNGAAGVIVRKLYESLGLQPIILFEEPDGNFPNHHPDPTIEKNLTALAAKVRETGAAVGIGFDGDADRIGVVDHTGRMILGDELIIIFGRNIAKKIPGSKIIGDVKCSDRLYSDLAKFGAKPIMWKSGHSLIKGKIKKEGAPFGGEMSGHVFFADRNYGYDDAPYAGLRLLEILSETGKDIPQLLEGLPSSYATPEIRIDTTEEKKIAVVNKLKEVFPQNCDEYQINTLDGIRVSFDNGWALARASNTQPVLVVRFESNTPEGLATIQSRFEKVIDPVLNG